MPPYAGFKGLADYIDQRCIHAHLTRHRLSLNLGKSSNYIHGICNGQFLPSPEMCREMAACFVDGSDAQAVAGEAHIIGVLAGLEQMPPSDEARAIADRIMGLSKRKREMVVTFMEFLASRK